MKRFFVLLLLVCAIVGCGADDDPSVEEEDTHPIVGTWELLTIDGMTLEESMQDAPFEGGTVHSESTDFLTFRPDSSFFRITTLLIEVSEIEDIDEFFDTIPDITLVISTVVEYGGTYSISDTGENDEIEFEITKRLDADVDISVEGKDAAAFRKLKDFQKDMSTMEIAMEISLKEAEVVLTLCKFRIRSNKLTLIYEIPEDNAYLREDDNDYEPDTTIYVYRK